MQFVLDDEVRRRERTGQTVSSPRLGGAVEPVVVVAVRAAEERAGLSHPRQRCELVHGGDQESR